MDTDTPTLKSKFNSAQLDLFRLNNLWQKTHYYAEKGLMNKWNIVLDRVYQELSNDTKPEDDKLFDEFQTKTENTANGAKTIKSYKNLFNRIGVNNE